MWLYVSVCFSRLCWAENEMKWSIDKDICMHSNTTRSCQDSGNSVVLFHTQLHPSDLLCLYLRVKSRGCAGTCDNTCHMHCQPSNIYIYHILIPNCSPLGVCFLLLFQCISAVLSPSVTKFILSSFSRLIFSRSCRIHLTISSCLMPTPTSQFAVLSKCRWRTGLQSEDWSSTDEVDCEPRFGSGDSCMRTLCFMVSFCGSINWSSYLLIKGVRIVWKHKLARNLGSWECLGFS